MSTPTPKEHIASLIDQLDSLSKLDYSGLDLLKQRAGMITRHVFGDTSRYINELDDVGFLPRFFPSSTEDRLISWNRGIFRYRNILSTMLEELELFDITPPSKETQQTHVDPNVETVKVFIVHGHDQVAKVNATRFIEKLGLEAVVLHERADSGNTIIEKFERESSDVSFAVILLTGDDLGEANANIAQPQPRARQNVVFELGYFVGLLGRSKVAALRAPDVEMPSDYQGVIYIDLDTTDAWKLSLAKNIKAAGIDIDMNRAI